MLDMIKNLIQEKVALQENAELILEDTMPNISDEIILGESYNDFDYDALTEAGEDTSVPDEDSEEVATEDTEDNLDEDTKDNDSDDIMNQSIDNNSSEDTTREPEPITDDQDDIMNQSLDNDTLPTPVGAQTKEPINDYNDILSMTIDIGSNTPNDILPVPPASASDAVPDTEDDIMNQRIDSGFGSECGDGECNDNNNSSTEFANESDYDNLMNEDIDESADDTDDVNDLAEAFINAMNDTDDIYTEEISLGDTESSDTPSTADAAKAMDAAANGTEPTAEDSSTQNTSSSESEDNPVTAAVKDKVAEADATDDVTTAAAPASSQEIMNKLSNITKNIEDVKKQIIASMQ